MLSDEEKERLTKELRTKGYREGIPGTIEFEKISQIPGTVEFEMDPYNAIAGSIGATRDSEITDSERESAAFHGVEEKYVEGQDYHVENCINQDVEDNFESIFFPDKFSDD